MIGRQNIVRPSFSICDMPQLYEQHTVYVVSRLCVAGQLQKLTQYLKNGDQIEPIDAHKKGNDLFARSRTSHVSDRTLGRRRFVALGVFLRAVNFQDVCALHVWHWCENWHRYLLSC